MGLTEGVVDPGEGLLISVSALRRRWRTMPDTEWATLPNRCFTDARYALGFLLVPTEIPLNQTGV